MIVDGDTMRKCLDRLTVDEWVRLRAIVLQDGVSDEEQDHRVALWRAQLFCETAARFGIFERAPDSKRGERRYRFTARGQGLGRERFVNIMCRLLRDRDPFYGEGAVQYDA